MFLLIDLYAKARVRFSERELIIIITIIIRTFVTRVVSANILNQRHRTVTSGS